MPSRSQSPPCFSCHSFHELHTFFPDFLLRRYAFLADWLWSSTLKRTFFGGGRSIFSLRSWTSEHLFFSLDTEPSRSAVSALPIAPLWETIPSVSSACWYSAFYVNKVEGLQCSLCYLCVCQRKELSQIILHLNRKFNLCAFQKFLVTNFIKLRYFGECCGYKYSRIKSDIVDVIETVHID